MHPQSSTLDPELARLLHRVPLCGKPKPKPLVEGAFIITRLSKREEKMSSLSMQERRACRYVEEALGTKTQCKKPGLTQ